MVPCSCDWKSCSYKKPELFFGVAMTNMPHPNPQEKLAQLDEMLGTVRIAERLCSISDWERCSCIQTINGRNQSHHYTNSLKTASLTNRLFSVRRRKPSRSSSRPMLTSESISRPRNAR